jgi:hypothetical protein
MKFLRDIYRRRLRHYRWANLIAGQFNWVYHHYLFIERHLRKIFLPSHSLLDNVSHLADISNDEADSAKILLLNNVTMIGHSRFILKNGQAGYDSSHPDFSLKDIYSAYCLQEECTGLMLYEPERARCHFPRLTIQAQLDGLWLSLMSGSTTNWMHWMSESIPRLVRTLAELKNRSFGLLVDQGMARNMHEVLDILAPDIIRFEVRPHHAVLVSKLIATAYPSGMCAVWMRPSYFASLSNPDLNTRFLPNGIHHFDFDGLLQSRKIIFQHFDVQPHKSKKLFIVRKSSWRHMINEEHIRMLLIDRGFELVSPGEMNVEQQVRLFSQANLVVAQAGAALANIMFMPADSKVICIAVQNDYTNFDYFRDYAKPFGVSIEFVVGTVDAPERYNANHTGDVTHPMNAELSCPEGELLAMIDRLQ